MRFEVKTVSFENFEQCTNAFLSMDQLDWNFYSLDEKNIADGLMVAQALALV